MSNGDKPANPDLSLLDGAVDTHVHTAPDLVERYETDLALAREALDAGMRGIVVKSHVVPTVGRVDQVNEAVGEEILYGGVALNGAVGGLNRDAVETALELGARVVWLPTAWSANHAGQARAAGRETFVGQRVPGADEDVRVVDNDGNVTEPTREVIERVADAGAVLGTGHVAPAEIEAVVEACADAGATALVNHPCFRVVDLPLETQERLAESGAVLEYCAYAIDSTEDHTVERVSEAIQRVGVDNAVLATDYGQADNPPVSGLARFASDVIAAGIDRETVQRLVRENPARTLGL